MNRSSQENEEDSTCILNDQWIVNFVRGVWNLHDGLEKDTYSQWR